MPSKPIFVIIESEDLEDIHLEMATSARRLADAFGERVTCAKIGPVEDSAVKELADYGVDHVCLLESPYLTQYCTETAELFTASLLDIINTETPRNVFFADNSVGVDLACRLASRMKIGLITGCVDLSLGEEKRIVHGKATHGGKVNSAFFGSPCVLEMATIRAGFMEKRKIGNGRSAGVSRIKPELSRAESPVKTLEIRQADPGSIGLDEADIIITGGRGMGCKENFRCLEELAEQLGGVVAGSLAAVDEGWIPRNRLVGQTGTTVEPKVYIACGVSGSIYHMLGMRDSKVIVAINTDRHAPIFKYADFGMVGDVIEVVPAMLNRLRSIA